MGHAHKSIFCPILTYGCESWVLTKDIRSRIQAAEMKYLRRIKGITRRDRVRNEVVRQELKVEPILKKIHKLKWFGHLMTMNNSKPIKMVWQARITGKKEEDARGKHGKIQYQTFQKKKKMLCGTRQIRKCKTGKMVRTKIRATIPDTRKGKRVWRL